MWWQAFALDPRPRKLFTVQAKSGQIYTPDRAPRHRADQPASLSSVCSRNATARHAHGKGKVLSGLSLYGARPFHFAFLMVIGAVTTAWFTYWMTAESLTNWKVRMGSAKSRRKLTFAQIAKAPR